MTRELLEQRLKNLENEVGNPLPRRWVWGGVALLTVLAAAAASADDSLTAEAIYKATRVRGGLVVELGCGDGKLTAALHAGDGYLVEGLDTDAKHVAAARQYVASLGLSGKVSVQSWQGSRLPYVDNLVNLFVASSPKDLGRLPMAEVLRVLAPGGVAWIGGKKTVKPRPHQIDDWTHALYDASGNAASNDRVVGPPEHLQWVAPPKNMRSHDVLAGISAVVTCGGRIFYIIDESPRAVVGIPSRWRLVARDAFNGVLLWKKPMGPWEPHLRGFRQGPPELGRRLVATGEAVYATLSIGGPVVALDAASGRLLRSFAGSQRAEEIVVAGGRLFTVTGDPPPKGANAARPGVGGPRLPFPRGTVHKRLLVFDAATGKLRWRKADGDTETLLPMTLAVAGNRVVFQNAGAVVCAGAAGGKTLWRFPRPASRLRQGWSAPTLVLHDGVVLSADRTAEPGDVAGYLGEPERAIPGYFKVHRFNYGGPGRLVAIGLESGQKLWEAPCAEGFNSPIDVFVVRGLVWAGQIPGRGSILPDYSLGRDLHTGKVVKRLKTDAAFTTTQHHRCYRDRVAGHYLVGGRTGVEFIDLDTGEGVRNNWVRGVCQYGIVPANGLLYAPPHACACYIESKLNGFYALAPKTKAAGGRQPGEEAADDAHRLQRGPAYMATLAPPAARQSSVRSLPSPSEDWPTYRHDQERSGRATTHVAATLAVAWRTTLPGRLSSPVIAQSLLLVAAVDAHAVYGLDAKTGAVRWTFRTGGRVDSPPTVYAGLALFGCADGWVYCLRAADGQLAWRFRAAPHERRVVAFGQVESAWPVPGSVLVHDGVLYCTAGRSSFLDGGIWLYRLDPRSGKVLGARVECDRDPKTGRQREDKVYWLDMPGSLPDVLSADGRFVYMRQNRYTAGDFRRAPFGRKTWPIPADLTYHDEVKVQPAFWEGLFQGEEGRHLYSPGGFLDGSWYHRAYWLYGNRFAPGYAGWTMARRYVPAGRILVMDESRVYGYGEIGRRFRLFAAEKESAAGRGLTAQGRGRQADEVQRDWVKPLPIHVRAMALADGLLFVAGHPDHLDGDDNGMALMRQAEKGNTAARLRLEDQLAACDGAGGGTLWVVRPADGGREGELKLDSPPVWDGLAVAQGRLYLATRRGQVVCLGPAP